MLQAPQVPYADAWRFLAHFLSEPFPHNVLGADNGHLEFFPDLVRVAELHWMAANQRLQTGVGLVLAMASGSVALLCVRKALGATESQRFWAAALVLALGLFWLGNFRALMHANETVHAYAVTFGLFAGVLFAQREGLMASVAAAGCAVFASLSFGSGLAVFPALLLVLALRRARWREWLPVCGAFICVLALMFALRDGTANTLGAPRFLGLLENLLRWLGGPPLFATWPLWDPEIAARVPISALRSTLLPIATLYDDAAGPVMLARWPHLAWGLIGAGVFMWSLLRSWRQGGALSVMGTAVSAFALCVGALIVLVRAVYFEEHADQLLAPRYLVWSSLFWAGLGLVAVDAFRPTRTAMFALLLCVLTLPSQLWMYRLGDGQRETAERSALAAAVGVVEPELPLGETVPEDLAKASPLLHNAQVAMFAWPEMQWQDRRPDAGDLCVVQVQSPRITVVGNRLGEPGRRVEFDALPHDAERLLLLDSDGVVRGIARRERAGHWLGWMRGSQFSGEVQVAALGRC